MGKQIQKEAFRLGLTNLPKYTFYAQPKKVKRMFSKFKTDTAYTVENWMKRVDPSFSMKESIGLRFFYMSTQLGVYIELFSKKAKGSRYNPDNWVSQIDIYTNNEDHVRAIAKSINSLWDDGILPHTDFNKIEKKFKVGKEEVINQWNAFL